jgi:hypothetical protein
MMEMIIDIHQLAQPHAQLIAMGNHTEWTSRIIMVALARKKGKKKFRLEVALLLLLDGD